MRKITVDVDKEGNCKIEGHGFVGLACDKAMAFLENALGKLGRKQPKNERWNKNVSQST